MFATSIDRCRSSRSRHRAWLLGSALMVAVGTAGAASAWSLIERVSVGPGGVQADGGSSIPAVSADGSIVAFIATADNLVRGDTNKMWDVFIHNTRTGNTRRVDLGPGGLQANGDALSRPAISADGMLIAFASRASNLVPGDTNGHADIFLRDRNTGVTEIVSRRAGGIQPNGDSDEPAISADGRFVAFTSQASNLVPGDTNGTYDVFVRDRKLHTTRRVSVGPGGIEGDGQSRGPAISADGRFVSFYSWAKNLVPGLVNQTQSVFIRDLQKGTNELVSVPLGGVQDTCNSSFSALSANGRFVAFDSCSGNLVLGDDNKAYDVFLRDRLQKTTVLLSRNRSGVVGNDYSGFPTISADGKIVAFESRATNLSSVASNGEWHVYAVDVRARDPRRMSEVQQVQGNEASLNPTLSADGAMVAFWSFADNLVPNDTNEAWDVFVRPVRAP